MATAKLHLSELNLRSAAIGKWNVGIFKPRIAEWTRPDGKPGAAFRAILVYLEDPECYVVAELGMRHGKKQPLETAQTKFQPNLQFCISKVGLDTKQKQQFLHCPMKVVVDLAKTTVTPLLS